MIRRRWKSFAPLAIVFALLSSAPAKGQQNGLGMWSQFFQLGTTYYPDKLKKWNASILSTWEICGTKLATNIKPGDQMTLEYGLGRRMFNYKLNIGVAGTYYRKLTLDSGTAIAFHDQENSIGPRFR